MNLYKLKTYCFSFLCLPIIICFGCRNQPTAPKPEYLIAEDTLAVILSETFIIEAELSARNPETRYPLIMGYYDSLFSKHHITKENFIESLNYYTSKDKKDITFLENITNNLMIKESQVAQDLTKLHPQE